MSLVPKILFFCIFKDLECTFGISVLSIILITFPHENDIIRMFFTGGSREPLHTLSTRFDVGNECVHLKFQVLLYDVFICDSKLP